jgi:2-acylglycerol O-acyltransferase 2
MVRVAPLKIPFERRLQTAAVLVVALTPVILILCNIFCILNPLMWPLYIGYLLWMVADSEAPHAGTRKQQWIRRLPIWKYFKDYFPARVIKTVDLDPQKTYMFGMHPHGWWASCLSFFGCPEYLTFCMHLQ